MKLSFVLACTLLALGWAASATAENALQPSDAAVTIDVLIAEFTAPGREGAAFEAEPADTALDRLRELERNGQVTISTRAQLTTLDRSKATVQIGERTPVVAGRTAIAGRRGEAGGGGGFPMQVNYQMENIGTIVSVTPGVRPDGSVAVDLQIEKSRLVPRPAAADGESGDGFAPPRTSTLTLRTTLRIPAGQTVIAGGLQSSAEAQSGQAIVLVSAKVSAAPTPPAAAVQQIKIFALQNAQAAEAAKMIRDLLAQHSPGLGIDKRTNSIIAQGTEAQLGKVEAILQSLDASPNKKTP